MDKTIRNRVGRRIFVTHCVGVMFDDSNDMHDVAYDIVGNITSPKRATNIIKKRMNLERVLVKQVSVTSRFYSMPAQKFIENADKVTD
nr:MAG TPA: hypothetical protein [Bacteriophage sp.]